MKQTVNPMRSYWDLVSTRCNQCSSSILGARAPLIPRDEKIIVAESSTCRQQDAKEHDASPDAYLGISQPRLQQTYIKSYEL